MVVVHHIAADMDALQIICAELALMVNALTLSRPLPGLSPLEAEYADFARWEPPAVPKCDAMVRAEG